MDTERDLNVLLIGSGGREHALAWKLAQSPRLGELYALPGNPGMAELAECVAGIAVDNHPAIIRLCEERNIDLVVVGPEAPLANGISDALEEAGILCFGPHKAAARIESSKAFSKDFMFKYGIPTARYKTFDHQADALKHLESVDYPVVIKASGLAAGKGVILPENLQEARLAVSAMLADRAFGDAGREVVIEERLDGPEISLMAFTDGMTVLPMPAAQDHKRLLDHDLGPNTGGMGAYAPAPIFTAGMLQAALEQILQPAVDGLRQEGVHYIGVLYAGLILTQSGLRALEFNCRFGDPEAQVVLPLLETDLLEVIEACLDGRLNKLDVTWKPASAACVVLASRGYPEKAETAQPVHFPRLPENTACFQAGTRFSETGKIVTSGGRVLGATAWAGTLAEAVQAAYGLAAAIHFEGRQYRTDIAWQALPGGAGVPSAYAGAGVSIDSGGRAVELMKSAVRATYTSSVLAGIGAFGGMFDASFIKTMDKPVLVASTDGVGTKVKLAAALGRYRGIGHDLVNHCINDILVQGARPLFFLDYFATSKLEPEQAAEVVTGLAEACRAAGMALLGGETAEMPGVYLPAEFDLAGTIVGVLEYDRALPRTKELRAGDLLVGLASSGPHTNGFSLIRKVFADTSLDVVHPALGMPLAEVLLAPHRSYFNLLYPQLGSVKALAHLTGGGFIENIPRILPDGLQAEIDLGSWPVPPLWKLIQEKGAIPTAEMYRVFNMGIGMLAVVDETLAARLQRDIPEETWLIGRLVPGPRRVRLVGA